MSNNCLIFIYCKQIIVCFIAEYLSNGVVIVNMASSELIYGFPKKKKKSELIYGLWLTVTNLGENAQKDCV